MRQWDLCRGSGRRVNDIPAALVTLGKLKLLLLLLTWVASRRRGFRLLSSPSCICLRLKPIFETLYRPASAIYLCPALP